MPQTPSSSEQFLKIMDSD
ncbi:hypothetical protein AVEN_116846-1, partial [Araneus ventricosus]